MHTNQPLASMGCPILLGLHGIYTQHVFATLCSRCSGQCDIKGINYNTQWKTFQFKIRWAIDTVLLS